LSLTDEKIKSAQVEIRFLAIFFGVLILIRTFFFALLFTFFAWVFSASGISGWFAFLSLLFAVVSTLINFGESLTTYFSEAQKRAGK
jgi:hypothetical protein